MASAATVPTLPFNPRIRQVTTGTSATPISNPEPAAPVAEAAGVAPGTPLSPEQQQAAFDRAHPFAVAGSFTPTPATPSVAAPGLFPEALPANLVARGSDPYADERGAGAAQALQRAVMPGLYPAGGYNGVAEVRNSTRTAARASGMTPFGTPSNGSGAMDFGEDAAAAGLSPVLTAALGLQQLKQQEVSGDLMANLASAGALLNPEVDTPEIRSRKIQYLDTLLANQAQGISRAPGTPMYTGDRRADQPGVMTKGGQSYAATAAGPMTALELASMSTQVPELNRALSTQLAQQAQRLMNQSKQPRLVNLGKDSLGREVEGVRDRNGNFSRIAAPNEGAGTQLNQLIKERDAWRAAGRTDVAEQYDTAIENYGQSYDAFGNPIRKGTSAAPTPAPQAEAPVAPGQPARQLSQADQQALQWAQANAKDERAKAILKRLGVEQ